MIDKQDGRKIRNNRKQRYKPTVSGRISNGKEGEKWGEEHSKGVINSVSRIEVVYFSRKNIKNSDILRRKLGRKKYNHLRYLFCHQWRNPEKYVFRHHLRRFLCLLVCFLVCQLLGHFLGHSLRIFCWYILQALLGILSRHHPHFISLWFLRLFLYLCALRQHSSTFLQLRYIRCLFRKPLRHFFGIKKQYILRRLLSHFWCLKSYQIYSMFCSVSHLRLHLRPRLWHYSWSYSYCVCDLGCSSGYQLQRYLFGLVSWLHCWNIVKVQLLLDHYLCQQLHLFSQLFSRFISCHCLLCLLASLLFQYSFIRYPLRHLLRFALLYLCSYFFWNNKRFTICRPLHHSLCQMENYFFSTSCISSNLRLFLRHFLWNKCWLYRRRCIYFIHWFFLVDALRRCYCHILRHNLHYYYLVEKYHRLLLKLEGYCYRYLLRQGLWNYRWNLQKQCVRKLCHPLYYLFQRWQCHLLCQHLHQLQRHYRLHRSRYPFLHPLRYFLWYLWCDDLCQLVIYLLCLWCKLFCCLSCSVWKDDLQYGQAFSSFSLWNTLLRLFCHSLDYQLYCSCYLWQQTCSYLTWNIVCVKLYYQYLVQLLLSSQLHCTDSLLGISWMFCCHLSLQTLCCDYYYCRYYSILVDNSRSVSSSLGSQAESQYQGFFLYPLWYRLFNLLRYKLCISGRYLLCLFTSYTCSLWSYLGFSSYSFFAQFSCRFIYRRVCGVWWRLNQLNEENGDVEWINVWIVELMWVCQNGSGERVDCNMKLKKYVSKYRSVKEERKKESGKVDYQLEEKERERTANRGMERRGWRMEKEKKNKLYKYRPGGSNKKLSNLGEFIFNKRRYIRKKKDRTELKRIKQLIIELVQKNSKTDRKIEYKKKLKVGDIRDSTLRINGKHIKHRGNTLECIGELILAVGLRQDRRKIRNLNRDWTKYPEGYSWEERYEELSEVNKMVKLRVLKRGDFINMGHFLSTEVEQYSRMQMKYLTTGVSNEIKSEVKKGDDQKLSWGFFGNSLEELGHNNYVKKVDTLSIYGPESPGCFNGLTLGQMITSGLEEYYPSKTMTIENLITTSVCDSGYAQWDQPESRWEKDKYAKVNHSSVVRKENQKTTITGHIRRILRRNGSNVKYNIRTRNIVTIGEKVREQRNKEEGISEATLYAIREQTYTGYRDRMMSKKEKSGRINKWGKLHYKVKRNIREGNGVDKERWHKVKHAKEEKNSILYINKRIENAKNRSKEKGMYTPNGRVIQRVYSRKNDKDKVRKFRLLWVAILPFKGYSRWHMAQTLRGCCPNKADIRLDRYDRYMEEMLVSRALYQAAKGNYKGRKIRYISMNIGLIKREGKRNIIQEGKWEEEEHISRKGRSKLRLTQGWGMYVNRLYGGGKERCNWKSKKDKKEK